MNNVSPLLAVPALLLAPLFGASAANGSANQLVVLQGEQGCADYCITIERAEEVFIHRIHRQGSVVEREVLTLEGLERMEVGLSGAPGSAPPPRYPVDLDADWNDALPVIASSSPWGDREAIVSFVSYIAAAEMVSVNMVLHLEDGELMNAHINTVRTALDAEGTN